MAEVLKKIRKGLYKLSELEFDKEEGNSLVAIKEFIENISYLRNSSEEEVINKFKFILLLNEDKSISFLFFIRSINNGLGERRIFRILLNYLAKENSNIIEKHISLIPKYGRWDDLYSLFDTPLENIVIKLFKSQISKDLNSKNPSTLGKWLKSENTSSKESRALGYKTRKLLNYSPKEYRKLLSTLRNNLNLVEKQIKVKDYKDINYEALSNTVMYKYKKAFYRNDSEKYNLYLKSKFNNGKYKPNKTVNYISTNINIENFNKKIDTFLNDILIKDVNKIEDSFIINGLEALNNEEISLLFFTIGLYKKINFNAFKNY